MANGRREMVGVRIDSGLKQELEELARREAKTLAELIRETLIEKLYPSVDEEITNQALFEQLLEARKDIALSTEALLIDAGSVELELASTWVRQNLRRE